VDGDGDPVPVECAPSSGSGFGFGKTTVTCTARAHGETRTKRFDITVVDTQPPAITVPPSKQVSTTSRSGKVVAYNASATDVVDGPTAVTCAPASGSRFPVGPTTVTCSASDSRSNVSSAAFAVTVVFKRATRSTTMLAPRAGETVRTAPMLRWRAAPKARFYNVQLFHRGHKVLTIWPTRARFRLRSQWTFRGRDFRLKAGGYAWFVWPAYGTQAKPRYGRMLGRSSFVYAGK
jgi:hypothetical protein